MAEGYFTRQKWLFLTAYFEIDIMQCSRAAFGVEVIHFACYILGDMFQLSLCLFAMMICNNLGMWVTVTVMKTLCCDSQFMKPFWGKFQPLFFSLSFFWKRDMLYCNVFLVWRWFMQIVQNFSLRQKFFWAWTKGLDNNIIPFLLHCLNVKKNVIAILVLGQLYFSSEVPTKAPI